MIRDNTPHVVSFVAWSGTGKTTLVEQLIKLATEQEIAVGALKHDAHNFEIDKPGKDSYRFTAAGALDTVIVSGERLALVRRHSSAPPVDQVITTFFDHCDLVLVEGWKTSSLPRIEVHRPGLGKPLLCRGDHNDPHLIAVASDGFVEVDVPVLDLNDPAAVLAFILTEEK
jgi:molybdopterin-guanine dinucleotide biosynthesis protein MobB